MATTTRIDANLSIPADRFKKELETLTADSDRAIGVVADAELGRAAKQEAIAARLEKKLGKDDPRVVRLRSSMVAHRARGTAHAEAVKRIGRLPKRNPEDCAVLGHVSDSSGKPVRGVRVRLTDKARAVDIGGRAATTDQFGEFSLVYPKCELGVVGGTTPEALLVVEDARKQVLFTSPQPVKTTRGRSVYFEIVLTSGPASVPMKHARGAADPAPPKGGKKARKGKAKPEGETSESAPRKGGRKALKRKPEAESKPATDEQGNDASKPARRKGGRKPRKTKSGPDEPKS